MNMAFGVNQMTTLHGSNFKKWKQDLELCLGMADYDHVLKEDPPAALTETSSKIVKSDFKNWHKHNRMSLMIMKRSMSEAVRGGIPESEFAREYLGFIEERFKLSDKAEVGNLLNKLISMKFDRVGSIREYIMKGIDVAAKLKNLNIPIDDALIVHLVLNSLPDQYSQIQSNYNTQKESWSVNELISIAVQEESRIKKGKGVAVNLVTKPHFKKKYPHKQYSSTEKDPSAPSTSKTHHVPNNNSKSFKTSGIKCFFCRKPGHVKKDCKSFKDWLVKKGFNKKEDPKQG